MCVQYNVSVVFDSPIYTSPMLKGLYLIITITIKTRLHDQYIAQDISAMRAFVNCIQTDFVCSRQSQPLGPYILYMVYGSNLICVLYIIRNLPVSLFLLHPFGKQSFQVSPDFLFISPSYTVLSFTLQSLSCDCLSK